MAPWCVTRASATARPTRGSLVVMTTLVGLDPVGVVRLYAFRFKIEVAFEAALHTVGAYAYHFWLKATPKTLRGDGNQYLHRASPEYRERLWRKLAVYELHARLGCIAQELLQHLAVNFRVGVWGHFRRWMRTMRPHATPSEAVAAQALRSCLPEFLLGNAPSDVLEKFLHRNVDRERVPGIIMAT